MRSCGNMPTMMQPAVFNDFNPLDVLAAAASLQSARVDENGSSGDAITGDDGLAEEESGDADGTSDDVDKAKNAKNKSEQQADISMQPPKEKPSSLHSILIKPMLPKSIVTLKDMTPPSQLSSSAVSSSKTLTVLRINKQQMNDHAYACQSLRTDEDEGYSSRSSIDEEGDDVGPRTSTSSQMADIGSPVGSDCSSPGNIFDRFQSPTSPPISRSKEVAKKTTKIVIVGNDSNLQKLMASSPDSKFVLKSASGSQIGSNVVLRTLLGQKPVLGPLSPPVTGGSGKKTVTLVQANVENNRTDTKQAAKLPAVATTSSVSEVTKMVRRLDSEEPALTTDLKCENPLPEKNSYEEKMDCVLERSCGVEKLDSAPDVVVDPLTPPPSQECINEDPLEVDEASSDLLQEETNVSVEHCTDNEIRISIPIHESQVGDAKGPESAPHLESLSDQLTEHSSVSELPNVKTLAPAEAVPFEALSDVCDNTNPSQSVSKDEDQNTNSSLSASLNIAPSTSVDDDHLETVAPASGSADEAENVTAKTDCEKSVSSVCETSTCSVSEPKENANSDQSEKVDSSLVSSSVSETLPESSVDAAMVDTEESSMISECVSFNDNDVPTCSSQRLAGDTSVSVTSTVPEAAAGQEARTLDPSIGTVAQKGILQASDVSVLTQESGVHHQYIIQDDVPPVVTKFGKEASVIAEKPVSVNMASVAMSAETSAVATSIPEVRPASAAITKPILSATQSLLRAPVSKQGTTPGLVHVIPVVSTGGSVVSQLMPRTVQYVTALSVAPKGLVRMATPRSNVGTIVMPNSVSTTLPLATSSALTAARPLGTGLLLVQPGSLKPSPVGKPSAELVIKNGALQRVDAPSKLDNTTVSSDLLGRHTPTVFGRKTPDLFLSRASEPGLLNSNPSSPAPACEKINFKIAANQISESAPSSVIGQEAGSSGDAQRERTSIGMMGSLSWQSVGKGLIQLGTGSNQREFIRIQGSQIQKTVSPTPDKSSVLDDCRKSPFLSGNADDDMSDDTNSSQDTEELSLDVSETSEDSNLSVPPVVTAGRRKRKTGRSGDASSWQLTSELHPLIDHDYCQFTDFNAQIQSSIIATTETKVKTERKYTKKMKAARTKITAPVTIARTEKVEKIMKGRRGRLKKKDALLRAQLKAAGVEKAAAYPPSEKKEKEPKKERRGPGRPEKKSTIEKKRLAQKDQKNYVKIPGSYQNDFVYFATRNYRTRPRKPVEPIMDPHAKPAKIPSVGGLNVFDWYRDLSKADKSHCFGSNTKASTMTTGLTTTTSSTGLNSAVKPITGPGATPTHESEVVDLVCQLSDIGNSLHEDKYFNTLDTTHKSEDGLPGEKHAEDLDSMAEHVRNMLNSLGEAELKMTIENLDDGAEHMNKMNAGTGLADSSFDGFLPDFTPEAGPNLSQASTSQLCDLDEINDSDLLTSDLGNMNAILGDLTSSRPANGVSTAAGSTRPADAVHTSSAHFLQPPISDFKLDKTELFPDIAPAPVEPSDSTPELIFVNMYWNDLPGLMMSGVEHVRLVDIHKQILPAKDTGILKKRCQMMGLPIVNCTELQRDFLVRYANAAKSKSTVTVSKETAKTLIGFYVDPRPRVARMTAEERAEQKANNAKAAALLAAGSKTGVETGGVSEASTSQVVVSQPTSPVAPDDAVMEVAVVKADMRSGGKGKRKRKRTNDGDESDFTPEGAEPAQLTEQKQPQLRRPLMAHSVKRSERLKHKKVKYADMANGIHDSDLDREDSKPVDVSPLNGVIKQEQESAPHLETLVAGLSEESEMSSDHENKDTSSKPLYPEDGEIRKLRAKARRKRLNKRDMRRLKKLREIVRRKEMRRKVREKRKSRLLQQKLNGQKSIKKLHETHAYTKKVNPEHCYAVCPDDFNKEGVKIEKEGVKFEHGADLDIKTETEMEEQVVMKEEVLEETDKVTISKPLAIVHRDVVRGNNSRGKCQPGRLQVEQLMSRDSPCIECCTCREVLSVRRFMKHLHHQNNPDELVEIALAQTLALRNPAPTQEELETWTVFEQRHAEINKQYLVKTPRRAPTPKTVPAEPKQVQVSDNVDSSPGISDGDRQVHVIGKEVVVKAEPSPEPLLPSTPQTVPPKVAQSRVTLSSDASRLTPNSLIRHSTRVRKQKQLHPIESYVFAKVSPVSDGKRARLDSPTNDPGSPSSSHGRAKLAVKNL